MKKAKKKINGKQKGNRGERELAKLLREYGFDGARRGQQFSGANGDPDVVGLPFIHIEVKRVEELRLESSLKQTREDAVDGEIPVVMHKKNYKPWIVIQDLDTWMQMYKAWLREQENEL